MKSCTLVFVLAIAALALAQPPNENCSGVIQILPSELPYSASDDITFSGNDFPEECYDGSTAPDVVFSYFGDGRWLEVSFCESFPGIIAEVRRAGACPGSQLVACPSQWDFCEDNPKTMFYAQTGYFYYIIVNGWDSGWGFIHYHMLVEEVAPPPDNPVDDCPGYAFSQLPFTHAGNTCFQPFDVGVNDCDFWPDLRADDVVYTFTPANCYSSVTAYMYGDGWDYTQLIVRTGGACPGSTEVGCHVRTHEDSATTSVTWTPVLGQQYYIIVTGLGDPQFGYCGYYIFYVDGEPTGCDGCPGTLITTLPFTSSGSTVGLTDDWGYACAGFSGADALYRLNLSQVSQCSPLVRVSLCNSNFDTQIFVRRDGACPGATQIVCNDDFCGVNNWRSEVTFTPLPSTDYYIIIDGYNGATGNYTINVTMETTPNPADLCPGLAINSLPYSHTSNTQCASHDFQPSCVPANPLPDAHYALTLPGPCGQVVTASLCNVINYFDNLIEVRTGGACPGSTLIACSDDFCDDVDAQVTFNADPGVTYYITVDGGDLDVIGSGPYTLNVTGGATYNLKDGCPGPLITSLPYTDNGSTACATHDMNPFCAAEFNGKDTHYQLNLGCNSTVTASLCGSNFDSIIEIRRDGACPGTTPVACNDDFCGQQSQVTFDAEAGVTYYITVDGYGFFDAGLYTLSITGLDNCEDTCPGRSITSLPYSDSGNTALLQSNSGVNCNGGFGNDAIYHLRLPECYNVLASLCNSSFDTQIMVLTDGACPGTAIVNCDDNSCNPNALISNFFVEAEKDYWIVIGGAAGATGNYTLELFGAPFDDLIIPQNVIITASGADIILDWEPSCGAEGYDIYGSTTSPVATTFENLVGATGPETTFTFVNQANAVTDKMFYVVLAYRADAASSRDRNAGLPAQKLEFLKPARPAARDESVR